MTTLVKRGTARRLGLRPADPMRHYWRRWAVIDSDVHTPPFYGHTLPCATLPRSPSGVFYTGDY